MPEFALQIEVRTEQPVPASHDIQLFGQSLAQGFLLLSCWPNTCQGQPQPRPIRRADVQVIHKKAPSRNALRLACRKKTVRLALAAAWKAGAGPCPVTCSHTRRTLTVLHDGNVQQTGLDAMFGPRKEAAVAEILRNLGALDPQPLVLWTDPDTRPYDPETDGAEYA